MQYHRDNPTLFKINLKSYNKPPTYSVNQGQNLLVDIYPYIHTHKMHACIYPPLWVNIPSKTAELHFELLEVKNWVSPCILVLKDVLANRIFS